MRNNILILVTGFSGSGKSTLCKQLVHVRPDLGWVNADAVREETNNWDFTDVGKTKQAYDMLERAEAAPQKIVLVDQICPQPKYRQILRPDKIIYVNTITVEQSRYPESARAYIPPASSEVLPGCFVELTHWIPNDSVQQFIDAFQPPYAVSNGRLAYEYRRQQLLLNNPEGLEALD